MEVGAGLSDFVRETGFGGCPLTDVIVVLEFHKQEEIIPVVLPLVNE